MKLALRSLLRTPRFTTLAVATLVLGFGVSTGIFSIVHELPLAPLPHAQPLDPWVFAIVPFTLAAIALRTQ